MHCPSCNKTLAAGTKCPKCGKLAVASSVDEIDLMPMDEPKVSGAAAFQPPPEAFLPPPSAKPAKRETKKETKKEAATQVDPSELGIPEAVLAKPRASAYEPPAESNMKFYIGSALALLVVLFGVWRAFRTENKIILGKPGFDTNWTVQANSVQLENYDISGTIKWTLEVTPADDLVRVGVVKRNPKDPKTLAALKALPDPYENVKKGEPYSASGEFKTGQYSVVVMNENKKPVKAKVKFKAQP